MTVVTDQSSCHPLVAEMLAEADRQMLSRYELAHALRVAPKTVLFWEKGQQPRLAQQRKIVAWLREASDA